MGDESKFEMAVQVVLPHEGGYVNDPSDPGGETKYGISKRTYPNLDIPNLTLDKAKAILKRDWWDLYGYGRFSNDVLALKVFDHAINIGWTRGALIAPRAHLFLQQAANEVIQAGYGTAGQLLAEDGKLGALTFETVNALCPVRLTLRLLSRVHDHYKRNAKAQPDKLPGWERRLWGCLP